MQSGYAVYHDRYTILISRPTIWTNQRQVQRLSGPASTCWTPKQPKQKRQIGSESPTPFSYSQKRLRFTRVCLIFFSQTSTMEQPIGADYAAAAAREVVKTITEKCEVRSPLRNHIDVPALLPAFRRLRRGYGQLGKAVKSRIRWSRRLSDDADCVSTTRMWRGRRCLGRCWRRHASSCRALGTPPETRSLSRRR